MFLQPVCDGSTSAGKGCRPRLPILLAAVLAIDSLILLIILASLLQGGSGDPTAEDVIPEF